ncbi:sugar-binding protein [Bacillus solitudinis]|uniref:sugar-binding protein n=1 Tax=Bacillus solitudinis TaxID=2014074 RepID=UPI001D0D4420|nr:sugar-binding protein [Bacillus solitudinis]
MTFYYFLTSVICLIVIVLLVQLLVKTLYLPTSFSEGLNNENEYHVVLIAEEVDNNYWRLLEKGAREVEEERNIILEYKGPNRSNVEEQMKVMDMAIASKADGIIVQASNEELFTPIINKAVENGIPVITIDADAPNSKRFAYVGTDNYLSGWKAGKALAEDMKGQAVVGIITGSLTSSHMQQRVQGFKDAVSHLKGIEIIAIEESNIMRIEAEEKANKILTEFENITAFLGTSALDGLGIHAAIKRLGKEDQVYVIAFDALPETMKLLKENKIHAVVAQEPYEMGIKGVELLISVLEGEFVEDLNYTSTNILRNTIEVKSQRP